MINKSPIYLMKFQNLDKLISIQSGKIYLKNIDYFIKLEETIKEKYIADSTEDSVVLPASQLYIRDKEGKSIIDLSVNKAVYSGGHVKQPIFCLFSLDYRNISMENGKKYMVFSKEQKKELTKFGTHVLLINDANEFVGRFVNALGKKRIGYQFGFVKYYKEEEAIKRFTEIVTKKKHIAFTKDYFPFAQQQEYRILLDIEVEDHFVINIGDLSDITEIIPIDEVLQRKYEI